MPLATVTTPVTVDREPTTGIVVQRVGDRVVGGVGVASQSGHADRRAVGGVFVNGVGRGVAVGDRSDVEFINVIDVDRHHGGVETAVAAEWLAR